MAQTDTFELTSSLIKGAAEKEKEARINDMKLYRSTTMKTQISPLYARYVGNTVTVAFQGNFKKFPVNGEEFAISQGHYNALMKYLRHIDRQIKIQTNSAKFMDTHASGDFKRL